ncbi:hypothetical protein L9F63_008002, partial [Diploptera punctata]
IFYKEIISMRDLIFVLFPNVDGSLYKLIKLILLAELHVLAGEYHNLSPWVDERPLLIISNSNRIGRGARKSLMYIFLQLKLPPLLKNAMKNHLISKWIVVEFSICDVHIFVMKLLSIDKTLSTLVNILFLNYENGRNCLYNWELYICAVPLKLKLQILFG